MPYLSPALGERFRIKTGRLLNYLQEVPLALAFALLTK